MKVRDATTKQRYQLTKNKIKKEVETYLINYLFSFYEYSSNFETDSFLMSFNTFYVINVTDEKTIKKM